MKTFQIYKLFCSVFYQGFFTRCAVIISVSDDGWDGNPGPGIQRYFLVLKTWMSDSLEIKSITMHNDLQLRCCQFPAEFMQHKRNSRIWFRILIFSGQWSGVGLMCMLEHWPSKYELPYCSQAHNIWQKTLFLRIQLETIFVLSYFSLDLWYVKMGRLWVPQICLPCCRWIWFKSLVCYLPLSVFNSSQKHWKRQIFDILMISESEVRGHVLTFGSPLIVFIPVVKVNNIGALLGGDTCDGCCAVVRWSGWW